MNGVLCFDSISHSQSAACFPVRLDTCSTFLVLVWNLVFKCSFDVSVVSPIYRAEGKHRIFEVLHVGPKIALGYAKDMILA